MITIETLESLNLVPETRYGRPTVVNVCKRSMSILSTVCNLFYLQANDFKEKKEQVLRQIDELGTIEQSPEVRSRKEVGVTHVIRVSGCPMFPEDTD